MIQIGIYLLNFAISSAIFWSRLKAVESAVNIAHSVLDLMERVFGYFREDDRLVTA
jgi:hypothetical protein